jgi:hypothetical protein
MTHWLVWIRKNPDLQRNRVVVCPNYEALGLSAYPHWRPV